MSNKETAKRSAIKDAEGRKHPSLSEIRNSSGLLGVFGLGFDIGWDACSRHEGRQKVTATHGVEFSDGSGIGTTYSVDKPAPIVSHPQYDVKQEAGEYAFNHNFVVGQIADIGTAHDKLYQAFIAGSDWRALKAGFSTSPLPEAVEIGAPISEMPLTGLVLDKLNQVIEMLQRQNNRYEDFVGMVQSDLNTLSSALDKQDIALERMELNAQRDASTNQDFNSRMLSSIENRLMEMQVRKAFGPDLDNWGNHLHDLIAPISDNVAEAKGMLSQVLTRQNDLDAVLSWKLQASDAPKLDTISDNVAQILGLMKADKADVAPDDPADVYVEAVHKPTDESGKSTGPDANGRVCLVLSGTGELYSAHPHLAASYEAQKEKILTLTNDTAARQKEIIRLQGIISEIANKALMK